MPQAEYKVGHLYLVLDDRQKGIEWLILADEHGNKDAAFRIGQLFETDNTSEAIKWYVKATEIKNIEALYRLGEIYRLGIGIEKILMRLVNGIVRCMIKHQDMTVTGQKVV